MIRSFIFYYRLHVGLVTGIANSSYLVSSMVMYIVVAMTSAAVAFKVSALTSSCFQAALLCNASRNQSLILWMQWGVMFLLGASVLALVVSALSLPKLAEYQVCVCLYRRVMSSSSLSLSLSLSLGR